MFIFISDNEESKRVVEICQGKIKQFVEFYLMSEFGERLKVAFGTQSISKIADRMGVSYQAVKNYVEGRIPDSDKLIEIASSTGCSIHWLLTGEGEKESGSKKQLNLDEVFERKMRELIRDELAKENRHPVFPINIGNKEEIENEKAA